jgi:hypothetical protein
MMRIITLAAGLALLAGAAQADSIPSQHGAEIESCNAFASHAARYTEAVYECLKVHGWLPGSGPPTVLDPKTVAAGNAAWAARGARYDAVSSYIAKCAKEAGLDNSVDVDKLSKEEWANRVSKKIDCENDAEKQIK